MAKSKKPGRPVERTKNGIIAPTPGILNRHSESQWGSLTDDILPFGLNTALQQIGADTEKVLRKHLGKDWWQRAKDIIYHAGSLSVLFDEQASRDKYQSLPWLATLRDELTDADKAELLDACYTQHHLDFVADSKALSKPIQHRLWMAICLGARWRELTLRPVENAATTGRKVISRNGRIGVKNKAAGDSKRATRQREVAAEIAAQKRNHQPVNFTKACTAVALRSGCTVRTVTLSVENIWTARQKKS